MNITCNLQRKRQEFKTAFHEQGGEGFGEAIHWRGAPKSGHVFESADAAMPSSQDSFA